jgi:hypothetical protein
MVCGALDKEPGTMATMAIATRSEDTYPRAPMGLLRAPFPGTTYGKRYIQIRKSEVTVEKKDAGGRILVKSHRKWFGDQRLGAFKVSVDGVPAGKVPPDGSLDVTCDPGSHTVRIRQWWYRSEPAQIHVSAGETVALKADIPRDGNPVARVAAFMFTPWRVLSLKETPNGSQ